MGRFDRKYNDACRHLINNTPFPFFYVEVINKKLKSSNWSLVNHICKGYELSYIVDSLKHVHVAKKYKPSANTISRINYQLNQFIDIYQ